jgi:hypothetical protein
MYFLHKYFSMGHGSRPKQTDMTNDFIYEDSGNKPGDFFYGVDQHLAFFIKIYVILFLLFLLIVLSVLKDYFMPGYSDSHFFSFLLFQAGL